MDDAKNNKVTEEMGAGGGLAAPPPADRTDRNPDYTAQFLERKLGFVLSRLVFRKKLTKRPRVVLWLVIAAKHNRTVTRFDSVYIGDHCLNTTISQITSRDRIILNRRDTKHPTRFGAPTECNEYWLEGVPVKTAHTLILAFLTDDSNERFVRLFGDE